MAYFDDLMDHIATFLRALLDRFLEVLGYFDATKAGLDKASEVAADAE